MNPLLIPLLVCMLCTNVYAGGEKLQDFSAAYELRVDVNSAIHSLELPREVYESVRRTDLGDVRVFNAEGDPVPHVLRRVEEAEKSFSERQQVPFFPLYFSNVGNRQEDLSVRVARQQSGMIVEVKSPFNTEDTGDPQEYLLDLSGINNQVAELEIIWDKIGDSGLLHVSIEQSNDLEQWTSLVSKTTLADIQYQGNHVLKRKISLGRVPQKYLKLSWRGDAHGFTIKEVYAHFSALPSDGAFHWVELRSYHLENDELQAVADFRLDIKINAETVQIVFPEKHSMSSLQVLSKKDGGREWNPRCRELFYDFRIESTGLRNRPCSFSATGDSIWRLMRDKDSSNGKNDLDGINIKLGWRHHELLFIGQGEPPFLLAFGNGKLTGKKLTPESQMILQALQKNPLKSAVNKAEIIKKVSLGGEQALLVPAPPIPWKKWVLWTVLIIGVVLLASMAHRLLKEMKEPKNGNVE